MIRILTNGDRYLHFDYLDAEFAQRHKMEYPTNYDVRIRAWFGEAEVGKVLKSQPYLFQHLQVPGQVYAISLGNSQNVLAIGIALPSLSDFLKRQPLQAGSEAYIYQQNGEIIA